MSAENIAIAGSTVTTAWSVFSSGFLHLPPSLVATGAGITGGISMAQAIKAKRESWRARRRQRDGDET